MAIVANSTKASNWRPAAVARSAGSPAIDKPFFDPWRPRCVVMQPKAVTPEETAPAWEALQIIAAPKIRQVYWCDFWIDARLPEMWKTRPVIVISYKNTLRGPCLVVPTSTNPQDDNQWACKLSIELQQNGVRSWAICNQLSTVSPSRFSQFKRKIPMVGREDFNEILKLISAWLPGPFSLENRAEVHHDPPAARVEPMSVARYGS